MTETEFIVALTEHRFLGPVLIPCLIKNCGKYYTIESYVKPADTKDNKAYPFKPYEKELVEIAARFSDQRLMKKFSRENNVSLFFSTLPDGYLEKHITPVVQKCLFQMAEILMLSPVRVFKKEPKYANLYDEDEIKTYPVYAHPVFYFEQTEEGIRYNLKTFIGPNEIILSDRFLKIVADEPCIMVYKNLLVVFESMNSKKIKPFMEKEFIKIPPAMRDKYFEGFILNTVRDFEVHASGFDIMEFSGDATGELRIEKNLWDEFQFVFRYCYGSEKFEINSNRRVSVRLVKNGQDYSFHKITRNFRDEALLTAKLQELKLVENNGFYYPSGWKILSKESAFYFLINWLNKHIPELQKVGISVNQSMLPKTYFTGIQTIDTKIKTLGDWFDVFIEVRFGEFVIPFIKLRKYILNYSREFELPDGQIAILPDEWFARYRGLFPLAHVNGNALQFRNHHYMLLKQSIAPADKTFADRYRELEISEKTAVDLPEGIHADLREYQLKGFRWMFQLYSFGFGGCLADDMGLGKTIQTLALLLKLKRKTNAAPVSMGQLDLFAPATAQTAHQNASLIVMPTSLVHNWYNEIKKFVPSLRVFNYTGPQRKSSDLVQIAALYDVVLTTYGVVRNDMEQISEIPFFYLILDESQYIKNPASKSYKAIMDLTAEHRLVLTGTPVENSLSDLWAQMNFLNKGILGNLAYFRRYYINPIEKQSDNQLNEKLREIIKPFILRRKKNEVARDLPPLTEQVIFCEMTPAQKKSYETEKSLVRNSILLNMEEKSVKKNSILILSGLTKLRQLANHPSMVDESAEEGSGKFSEIMSMLENVIAEKHKALVFSSFVEHLKLIQTELDHHGWDYCMLTGQTTNREKEIDRFRTEDQNRIFLVSLKAGGVGLNLTEADYVFILDPWWNPAAENQAINRAHRIGQQKNVFVYRFITGGTIEEKIQQLKEKKSQLADKFINSNNPFSEGVTAEEILELI